MLSDFILEHRLPAAFASTARQWFIPTANQIAKKASTSLAPFFIGINGCQGSGKSTLAAFIAHHLSQEHGLTVVNLSLDDFYLSQDKRADLAETVHPLLATRGVPGTHDTELLSYTLAALKNGQPVAIPRFDKSQDNPVDSQLWELAPKKADIVILEGWCWGVMPQNIVELKQSINDLEQQHDEDGRWRLYVNQQIASHYQPLYQLMNTWLMLHAPSFDCVANWRWQQEQMLATNPDVKKNNQVMNRQQVMDFIAFFQRLTEHALVSLPEKCNLVFSLDENRKIDSTLGRI